MQKQTQHDLLASMSKYAVGNMLPDVPNASRRQIEIEFQVFAASSDLLTQYLGSDWNMEVLQSDLQDVRKEWRAAHDFMHSGSDRATQSPTHTYRVRRLAEMLYNLQDVDGIDRVVEAIRKGDLES